MEAPPPENSFLNLDPDLVLRSVEQWGFQLTGQLTQLNSYENRVFDLKLEETSQKAWGLSANSVVAKFYRPQRWTLDAIQEEHTFLEDLVQEGLFAVAPLKMRSLSSDFAAPTLLYQNGLWVTVFPKVLGRLPQEFTIEEYEKAGRLLAQIHKVGLQKNYAHRLQLASDLHIGWSSLNELQKWVQPELLSRYNNASEIILDYIDSEISPHEMQRIHGDLHKGNLLQNSEGYFLVDFDDSVEGPVIQDFWMLLSGDDLTFKEEMEAMVKGYETLLTFPDHQIEWISALRGYRIINYGAWIARRWTDPSFPRLFPDFLEYKYWAQEVENLEKIAWRL